MPIHVSVRNLSKAYGRVAAVSGVSFEIAAGEIFGLLGPNGAGKTTTLESVVGLIQPDGGKIEICGIDVRRRPAAAREVMGVALQSTGLQDRITPREALDMFGGFYRAPLATDFLLERFGLTGKARAPYGSLSGGQRQRVALALAFVNDPKALFLDEPTAGLDPQMRRELHDHIRQFRSDGRALLLTTHDMDEAEQLCDRIAVVDGGRIVAQGAPRDLIAASKAAIGVTIKLSAPPPEGPAPIAGMTWDGPNGRFRTTHLNGAMVELVAWLDAHEIQIVGVRAARASLEEVILDLTKTPSRGTAP